MLENINIETNSKLVEGNVTYIQDQRGLYINTSVNLLCVINELSVSFLSKAT